MTLTQKIAFLGAGNMAGALIRGIASRIADPDHVWATDPRQERLDELASAHSIRTGTDNAEAARWADVVVLAVKPQVFRALFADVGDVLGSDHLVVSVAAGVSIRAIEGGLAEGARVVRAMPNTPALVHAGVTAYARGSAATDDDLVLARTLFESVGTTLEVEERHLDAVTGLSGSGPAYVFRLIEGLVAGGEASGLDPAAALTLASQTVLGAAKLLVESGESPARLRENVTSPNGTTEAGLAHLDRHRFVGTVEGAVRAATARSATLGAETEDTLQ